MGSLRTPQWLEDSSLVQPPWSWRGSLSTAVAAWVDWRMWGCLMSIEANSWASWWSAWPPCWLKLGCYKVTLNCNDKMIKFYSSLGYKSEDGNSNYMCIRIHSQSSNEFINVM